MRRDTSRELLQVERLAKLVLAVPAQQAGVPMGTFYGGLRGKELRDTSQKAASRLTLR